MAARGMTQLKVGLRVGDLDASCALYLGRTWLILSDRFQHGYHSAQRRDAALSGPLGSGFVLGIPVPDLDATYDRWRAEGLPVTLEPQDAYWARIFYGLDLDGYELMFEQHHPINRQT